MKKSITKKSIAVLVGMTVMLTACGQKAPSAPETKAETQSESETEEMILEIQQDEEETVKAETGKVSETEQTQQTQAESKRPSETGRYEDNFTVPSEDVAAFAEKIKTAVEAEDMEALADLASFPMYIGSMEGGSSVDSREAFLNLGAEKIFTPEMTASIKNADSSSLSPSMAGFSLTESGRPNIIFGVVNGTLAIQGMNY